MESGTTTQAARPSGSRRIRDIVRFWRREIVILVGAKTLVLILTIRHNHGDEVPSLVRLKLLRAYGARTLDELATWPLPIVMTFLASVMVAPCLLAPMLYRTMRAETTRAPDATLGLRLLAGLSIAAVLSTAAMLLSFAWLRTWTDVANVAALALRADAICIALVTPAIALTLIVRALTPRPVFAAALLAVLLAVSGYAGSGGLGVWLEAPWLSTQTALSLLVSGALQEVARGAFALGGWAGALYVLAWSSHARIHRSESTPATQEGTAGQLAGGPRC